MCSGATWLLTATTGRTRTVTKTLWLRLEPFRPWRELYTLWMNSQQIIGTFMDGGWYSASKSGRTVTVCRTQLHRTAHYPAVSPPNLDECPEKCGANKTSMSYVIICFVRLILILEVECDQNRECESLVSNFKKLWIHKNKNTKIGHWTYSNFLLRNFQGCTFPFDSDCKVFIFDIA